MNFLSDPLLTLSSPEGQVSVNFPELLSLLAADRVRDLPFLRPHQAAPWHAFCVQLAALAMHRAGIDVVPEEPEVWGDLLRALTAPWPEDEPWRLVVDDVTQPAFLQAPVPKGAGDPHRSLVETPDDLDVLVSSKNHGLKQTMATEATPAAWIAALVTLQTTGGFLGSGNYGIARMNGGFATRPSIGLVPAGGPGARWRRDLTVILQRRDWFFEQVDEFAPEGGHGLLWCLPWSGNESLELASLDPYFVEICRRVRLRMDANGMLSARTAGSAATRVAAKGRNGHVGDPWIPIRRKDGAAYNTTPRYPVMSSVLFDQGEWLRPLLLDWHPGIDPPVMTARFDVVVRGQGVTDGHHVRQVIFEGEEPLGLLMIAAKRDRAAELSKEMIEHARTLRLKVLKIALLTLIQAGEHTLNFGDNTSNGWTEPWLRHIDAAIEPVFFDYLFARAQGHQGADQAWVQFLQAVARKTFEDAIQALPIAGNRRIKAIAVAEGKLAATFANSFGGYLTKETADAA
jgi:CRISPR system Cascade subunit CasA